MVIICCPPHLLPTQTILCPTQPHSEPKQVHPDGRVILVSNWVQPIGGTDCRSETGERKLVGRRAEEEGISFSTASLLQMRLRQDLRSPGLEVWRDRFFSETWTCIRHQNSNAVSSLCPFNTWGSDVFCHFLLLVLHNSLLVPFTLLALP